MNKKTVLSVLLCCALLSTATSCNRSNVIYSNNSTDSQFLEENTSAYTQQIENVDNQIFDTNTSSQNSSMSVILNDILQQQYTWSEFNAIYPQYEITAQSPIAMNIVVPEFENVIFVFSGDLNDNISEYKMASANASGDVLLPEHFGKTFDQILSEEAASASAEPSDEFMQHLYKYESIYIYREDFYYYIRGYRHGNELNLDHIAMFRYDESHPRPW